MQGIRTLAASAMIVTTISGAAGAETVFDGDWSRPVAPGGAGAWRYLHTMRPDSMRIETDPKRGRVAHFVVRPGDKVGGWSGERSEVAIMQDRKGNRMGVTPASGREFYGISVKVAQDWMPPERNSAGETWGMVFQLHGPDNLKAPPSLSLDLLAGFHLGLHGGALRRQPPSAYRLSDGSLNLGRWVEFLMDVKWSAEPQGWVVVWRRDEGSDQFKKVLDVTNIANLQYGAGQPVGEHYWKAGFYRSEGRSRIHEVWLGPVVRGTSRDEVAKAAFGRP